MGASRGLGLALVGELLRAGHDVAALYNNPGRGLMPLAEQFGDRLLLHHANVTQEHTLETAASALAGFRSQFDQLIFNAAVHLEQQQPDVLQADIEAISKTFDVNTVGAIRAVKHLRPLLRDSGQLVLISSEAGSIGDCWRDREYGYCMSKAALNMFAKLLEERERKRGSGLDVRAVHPGWLRTEMGGPHADDSASHAAEQLLAFLAGPRQALYTDRQGKRLAF